MFTGGNRPRAGEIGLDSPHGSTNPVFPWTVNAITLLDIDRESCKHGLMNWYHVERHKDPLLYFL